MADVELTVKHGKDVHKLTLASTATLGELRGQLHTCAGAFPTQTALTCQGSRMWRLLRRRSWARVLSALRTMVRTAQAGRYRERLTRLAKTLDQLGIGHGAKLMLVGTKMHGTRTASCAGVTRQRYCR